MAKSEDVVHFVMGKIGNGELKAGDRLPTHRDMAWDQKCSVGTVTRAYAELERRGVTYGQVGRGTYVFGTQQDNEHVGRGMFLPIDNEALSEPGIFADLSLNSFHHPDLGASYKSAFEMLSNHGPQSGYRSYFDCRGRPSDRHYASQWLEHLIGEVNGNNILITQGAQSGLYSAMAALTNTGDSIATEAYGYPGIKAAAQELGLRISAIEMDDLGMIPEAFEAAVKRGKIRLLVTVPTNHNPTGTTVPIERRRKIIRIAQDHNVLILEDGVYGPLQVKEVPTYRELCPETGLYLTSFSKVFSPGLRVGYLVAPENLIPRLVSRLTAVNWMTSPITLDISNYLLDTKVIQKYEADHKKECEKRFVFAKNLLKPWLSEAVVESGVYLPHLWARLPTSLASSAMIEQARSEGIALIGGDRFAMNRQLDDHFVRICLMAVPKFEDFQRAITILYRILSGKTAAALIS
ncbi:MAG: PLP-dependent aminotransferase family protein [Sneathiella sp.]|nr:PLP-dependent aminotransferase family protein [Sneathiella sp.]